jgi:hypothetical protein
MDSQQTLIELCKTNVKKRKLHLPWYVESQHTYAAPKYIATNGLQRSSGDRNLHFLYPMSLATTTATQIMNTP